MTMTFQVGQRVRVTKIDEPYYRDTFPDIQARAGQTGTVVSLPKKVEATSQSDELTITKEYQEVKMDEDGATINLPPKALVPEDA